VICKNCGYPDSKVVQTRQDKNDDIIRRRECIKCRVRYTTVENLKQNYKKYPYIKEAIK
jgi:transcriptional regulator NrdR family protein